MPNSGSFDNRYTVNTNNYADISVTWAASQNSADNTSTVSLNIVWMARRSPSNPLIRDFSPTGYQIGTQAIAITADDCDRTETSTDSIYTYVATAVVPHEADGTKSCLLSATAKYNSGNTLTASSTVMFEPIVQAAVNVWVKTSSGWKRATAVKVKTSSGWKDAASAKYKSSSGWK